MPPLPSPTTSGDSEFPLSIKRRSPIAKSVVAGVLIGKKKLDPAALTPLTWKVKSGAPPPPRKLSETVRISLSLYPTPELTSSIKISPTMVIVILNEAPVPVPPVGLIKVYIPVSLNEFGLPILSIPAICPPAIRNCAPPQRVTPAVSILLPNCSYR